MSLLLSQENVTLGETKRAPLTLLVRQLRFESYAGQPCTLLLAVSADWPPFQPSSCPQQSSHSAPLCGEAVVEDVAGNEVSGMALQLLFVLSVAHACATYE